MRNGLSELPKAQSVPACPCRDGSSPEVAATGVATLVSYSVCLPLKAQPKAQPSGRVVEKRRHDAGSDSKLAP